MMTPPVTHVLPLTTFRRTRLLPSAGNILVRNGQKVNPTDIVAETYHFPVHSFIDVGRAFSVTSPAEAEELIQVKPGDQLQIGDIIAQKKGLFRKVLRAKQAGRIFFTTGGQVWVELPGKRFELRAGYPGTVTEIIPERGIKLVISGALIQAAWGNGKIDESTIVSFPQSAGEELLPEKIDISSRGGFVFSGYLGKAEVLQLAAQLPLRGLILGSMAAKLVPLAISMPYPIILTEGFGRIPVNRNAFTILTSNQNRSVSLFGLNWDFFSGQRPEITIALPATGDEAQDVTIFQSGKQVRFLAEPAAGEIGELEQFDLQQGSAVVKLSDNKRIQVPLANLDVLE
jgi:hypothetical protein